MHKGVCLGGPMAGQTVTTRSEVGFVAVDAAGFAAWVYRIRTPDGAYALDLSLDDSSLDENGTRALDLERALYAGTDKGLDVIALPGEDQEEPAEPPVFDDDSPDQAGDF
jgi:hypothetical protein